MSTTNILDLNNRIDELEKNSGGSSDSARYYTVNVPDTAISINWVGTIYYATITLDAPENLLNKKVIMSFDRGTGSVILGWTTRISQDGESISFTMCRPDNTATVGGKLYILVKD